MKNLITFKKITSAVTLAPWVARPDGKEQVAREVEQIAALAVDHGIGRYYFLTDQCNIYGILASSSAVVLEHSLLNDSPAASLSLPCPIIAMDFVIELDAIVIATATGELLQFQPDTQDLEIVGTITGGIAALAWSPDGEVVALVTKLGRVLMMTNGWDVLTEVPLEQTLKEDKAAVPNGAEVDGIMSDVALSWRGDGKFFVTIGGEKGTNSGRGIRVWEREGCVLHACQLDTPDLHCPIAWSQGGALIAAAKGSPSGPVEIALFERNGLPRGDFLLEAPPGAEVSQLGWSCDSELLVVVLRTAEWHAIQIWYRGNYYWYCKKEWRFPPRKQIRAMWDLEKPLTLHAWSVDGDFHSWFLSWETGVCYHSTSGVIDGRHVLITPLNDALVPPPLAIARVQFPAPVQSVALTERNPVGSATRGREVIAGGCSDGSLAFAASGPAGYWGKGEVGALDTVASAVTVKFHETFKGFRHLCWVGADRLLTVAVSSGSSLGEIDLECLVEIAVKVEEEQAADDGEGSFVRDSAVVCCEVEKETPMPEHQTVLKVIPDPTSSLRVKAGGSPSVFVQMDDGAVYRYIAEHGFEGARSSEELPEPLFRFPVLCPWMCAAVYCPPGGVGANLIGKHVIVDAGVKGPEGEQVGVVVLGRCEKSLLFVGSQMAATNCTSMALHSMPGSGEEVGNNIHVVYTQNDMLRVFSLDRYLRTFGERPAGELGGRGLPVWEKGAKIVGALSGGDVGVVLQTVRGNLETLYPRELVLAAVGAALRRLDYREAMAMARRHRLDLNFLVDFPGGWRSFIGHVAEFVKQVDNLAHVSELICTLNAEDVTHGLYHGLLPVPMDTEAPPTPAEAPAAAAQEEFGGKVRAVCREVRQALEAGLVPDSAARETCILTCLAKSNPQELDVALQRIKTLREAELRQDDIAGTLSDLSVKEAAIKAESADVAGPASTSAESADVAGTASTSAEAAVDAARGPDSSAEAGVDDGPADQANADAKSACHGGSAAAGDAADGGAAADVDARSAGGQAGTADRAGGRLSVEAALRHLMVLADADRLFAVALGTYDLQLAALVASHSQRDPLEYLPFLKKLEKMPGPLQRFTIDKQLGLLESALNHLAEAGPSHFHQCLHLVKTNPWLFPKAAEIYSRDREHNKERSVVMDAWGDQLLAEDRQADAALAFCACGNMDKAMTAYRSGGLWQQLFTLAGRRGLSPDETKQLAVEVVEEVAALGRVADAAAIALDYAGDGERAVSLLVQAHEWREAVRVAYKCGQGALVDSQVAPAAASAAQAHGVEFELGVVKVEKYLTRWRTVRTNRLQLQQAVREANVEEGHGDTADDSGSVSGSSLSGLSLYTKSPSRQWAPSVISTAPSGSRASTKGRVNRRGTRRTAQGGGKIRAGSAGEESSLVEHVAGLAASAQLQEEVRELAELLVLFGKESLAVELQRKFLSFSAAQAAAAIEMAAAQASEMHDGDDALVPDVAQQKVGTAKMETGMNGHGSSKQEKLFHNVAAMKAPKGWAILDTHLDGVSKKQPRTVGVSFVDIIRIEDQV